MKKLVISILVLTLLLALTLIEQNHTTPESQPSASEHIKSNPLLSNQ